MSETRRPEKALVPSDTDWISALPHGVLGHILGFLPADEAVRTCVLSRRWLHQWRFIRCLRVTSHEVWKKSRDGINLFVSSLLLLRDPGPALDELELNFAYDYERSDEENATYEPSVSLFAQYNLVLPVGYQQLALHVHVPATYIARRCVHACEADRAKDGEIVLFP
jgi:hypothetical protein